MVQIVGHGFMAMKNACFDFPDGLTLLTGQNGTGKSTALEAVAWAFYGKTLRGTNPWNEAVPAKDRYLRVSSGGIDVLLPDLVVRDARAGRMASEPVTYANGRQMYAALQGMVGSFEEWRLASVLSSEDVANFSGATPAQRMALLSTVLRMGVLEEAAERARLSCQALREKIRKVGTDRQTLTARIEAAERALAAVESSERLLAIDEAAPSAPAESFDLATSLRADAAALRAFQRASAEALPAARCEACGAPKGESDEFRAQSRLRQQNIAELEDDAARIERLWRAHQLEFDDWNRRKRHAQQVRDGLMELEDRLESDRQQRGDLDAVESVLADRLRLEEAAHKALAQDIPYDMLEEGFQAFTRIANGYLERIAGEKIRVRIAGTRELASGRAKQEASLVVEGLGGPRGQYESASSGERRRIDLALLLAVGDLAREYAGFPAGPLFLDEALDSLDMEGRAAVVDVLAELGEDRPIILISHEVLPVRYVQHLELKG